MPNLFTSIQFTILLLVLIAAASVWGSLIGSDPERGVAFARAKVFNSWWYTTLLALLGINLALCTVQRLKSVSSQLRRAPFHRDTNFYRRAEVSHELSWNGDLSALQPTFAKTFPSSRIEKNALYARKGVLSFFGSPIVHLGVIIIILGGLLRFVGAKSGFAVFDGQIVIPEGESAASFFVLKDPRKPVTMDNLEENPLDFELRCLDFREEKFPDSDVPRYYASLIEVHDDERGFFFQIDMTKPLTYKGYKFHQTSFREDPEMERALVEVNYDGTSPTVAVVEVSPRAPIKIPDSRLMLELDGLQSGAPWRMYDLGSLNEVAAGELSWISPDEFAFGVTRFLPDFRMDADGRAYSESDEPRNPAVKIVVLENGKARSSGWFFQKPEFRTFSSGKDEEFDFVFLRYQPDQSQGESRYRFLIQVLKRQLGDEEGTFWMEEGQWKSLTRDDATSPTARESVSPERSPAEYEVRFLRPVVGYATILGVTKDPSIWFSYVGGSLLLIGVLLAFLMRYTQLWAYFDEQEGKLYVALRSRGDPARAQRELARLLDEIKNLDPSAQLEEKDPERG